MDLVLQGEMLKVMWKERVSGMNCLVVRIIQQPSIHAIFNAEREEFHRHDVTFLKKKMRLHFTTTTLYVVVHQTLSSSVSVWL